MMVTPLGSDLSPVEHLWDVVKLEILIVDTAGKSAAAVWWCHVIIDQMLNVWHDDLEQLWR